MCGTRDCSRASGFRRGRLSSNACPPGGASWGHSKVAAPVTARPCRLRAEEGGGEVRRGGGEEEGGDVFKANARSQRDESQGAEKDTNPEEKMAQVLIPGQSGRGTSDYIVCLNLSFLNVVYALIGPPGGNSYGIIGWCQNVQVKNTILVIQRPAG